MGTYYKTYCTSSSQHLETILYKHDQDKKAQMVPA